MDMDVWRMVADEWKSALKKMDKMELVGEAAISALEKIDPDADTSRSALEFINAPIGEDEDLEIP